MYEIWHHTLSYDICYMISVRFTWVILAFKIHSWGLICLILWFTPLFSLFCLVLVVLILISDLNLLNPSVWTKEWFLTPRWSMKQAKETQNNPMRVYVGIYHGQGRNNKKQQKRNGSSPPVTTTASGGSHYWRDWKKN